MSKSINICILIIATDNNSIYRHFIEIWEKYMNINSNIKCYLLYNDPTIKKEYIIETNKIITKYKESIRPGVLQKTLKAMEILSKNKIIEKYDYIIRTNLSTFWIYERLIEYLKNIPKSGFFGSPIMELKDNNNIKTGEFGSGTCMIFSKELIKIIVDNINNFCLERADDVAISLLLIRNNINITNIERYDFTDGSISNINSRINQIKKDIFIIRVKNPEREHIDHIIIDKLYNHYYKKNKLIDEIKSMDILNNELYNKINNYFDWEFYLNYYKDLKKNLKYSKDDAIKHWEKYGKKERRITNYYQLSLINNYLRDTKYYFNWKEYYEKNKDIKNNEISVLKHWINK